MPGINTTSITPASWLDVVIVIWLVVAVVCTAYVAYDAFTKNPEMTVMKWGFVIVTLYLGPIGLVLYVMSCKEPRPGEHEAFIKPLWRQGVGSTMHCVAGDATGIVIAAAITSALGLPMWLDGTLEYAAGFGVGLLVFQAVFMRGMMGGSYLGAVRSSFRSEVAVDEHDDGRHAAHDVRAHGVGHDVDGAFVDQVLGRDVDRCHRRVLHRLPDESVACRPGPEARHDHRPVRVGGRPQDERRAAVAS